MRYLAYFAILRHANLSLVDEAHCMGHRQWQTFKQIAEFFDLFFSSGDFYTFLYIVYHSPDLKLINW